MPISDIERIGLNLRYENTSIDVGTKSSSQNLDFTSSGYLIPIGSGPYKIKNVDPRKNITYTRIKIHWGK